MDIDELKIFLENRSKKFKKLKEKQFNKETLKQWKKRNLPNPFKIVRDFIIEKGLKLYGGLALHEHLKQYDQGIYESYEFPDYDVFSPNAWEHAKELTKRFYDKGFYYAEAKSSILNYGSHYTYKVGVDMMYVLDLTQVGCTPKQMENKDCNKCGITTDGKCISIFNNIPAVNLLNYKNKKVIYSSYDYEKDTGMYKYLLVCDPTWLKISMYRELTEPLSDPKRVPKVGERLEKFNKIFSYNEDKRICSKTLYKTTVQSKLINPLKDISNFIIKNKLINYGATAYNLFIKNYDTKNLGNLNVSDYQVYSKNASKDCDKLLDILKNKYPNLSFQKQKKLKYWLGVDSKNYTINVSDNKDLKYNDIITFTYFKICMPYIQYNKVRYATIDRMKFILYKAVALKNIYPDLEENPKNYECMLSFLISAEKEYKKQNPNSKKSKFRRYVSKCEGLEESQIKENLKLFSLKKILDLKNTKYLKDTPKDGFITKIYPMIKDETQLPYRPLENAYKKYYKKITTKKNKDRYIKLNTNK